MSTTLTNGLKLPDKGSVDWYADMQSNYAILDGSVGTIAAHTAALAGKAPAVHTHTKADITDFPAYGNAAGTICEGNDSRLSDARTPVAHTHTKSDITDLFNSANTWSEEQIFSSGMCLNGDRNAYIYPMWGGAASGIAFLVIDGSKQFVFGQRTTDANNRYVYDATKGYLVIKTGETDGTNFVEVTPSGTDTKLGTSSAKWKSFNGVNPGALGIPNKDNKADIASEFTDLTGGNNFYIPPVDGFVSINADTEVYCAVVSPTHNTAFWRQSAVATTTGYASVTIPVRAGLHLLVKIKSTGAIYAEFYPCLGNV